MVNWFRKKKIRVERGDEGHFLQLGYQVGGHKFYIYNDYQDFPFTRHTQLIQHYDSFEIGVDKNDIIQAFAKIIDYNNKGKVSEVGAIANYAKLLVENVASSRMITEAEKICALLDDEPVEWGVHSQVYGVEKERLWVQYPELRFFFINVGINFYKNIHLLPLF